MILPRVLRSTAPARVFARTFSSTPAAANVARMTIIGRLGNDVESLTTSNGMEIMRYSLATNIGPADNRQTNWWRIQSFDNRPEAKERMSQLLKKGALVYVDGNASMRKYEGENGRQEQALNITQISYRILQNPRDKGESMEEE